MKQRKRDLTKFLLRKNKTKRYFNVEERYIMIYRLNQRILTANKGKHRFVCFYLHDLIEVLLISLEVFLKMKKNIRYHFVELNILIRILYIYLLILVFVFEVLLYDLLNVVFHF